MAKADATLTVGADTTQFERQLKAAAQRAGKSLNVGLSGSSKSIDALSQPLGRITGKADEFTKSMEAANARVLAFGASVGVLSAVTRGFKELVATTIQVEKQLASINTILNRDAAGLSAFKKEIFDVAKATEQSFDTVADAALELSRQGLSAEEVLSRLNDAMVLSRLSGLGAAESVSGLTAAINSFKKAGLESSEILNKLSAAAASAAVSERDLIEGIKRSASVANQASVEFDELVGVITAVQQKTARGGAVIGNSFKTIFTRLQSFKNLETLQDLGVDVTDASGKVKSATELIEQLGKATRDLPAAAVQDIGTQLVGRFQIAPFLAILDDYNSKTSIARDITKTAADATTEAYTRNEALNKTLAAAINETVVSAKELANTLGELGVTDNFKNIVNTFSSILEFLQSSLNEETGSTLAKNLVKGIGNVISGPGLAIVIAIVGKLFADLAIFGVKSINTFFGIASASKDIAATQGQIASSLVNNKGVQDAILNIERSSLSVGDKRKLQAQFFTEALNTQYNKMLQMQNIAGRIAPMVVAGTSGLTAKSSRGSFLRGFSGKGKASGYIPSLAGGYSAEKQAISMGVGGAPSTAKPVPIPNFNFGGGMVGPVVANNSEFLVPNFGGGGGSAIFNQDMAASMGLPPNARPINAAGGIKGMQTFRKGKQTGKDDRFAMLTPEPTPVRIGSGIASTGEKFKFNIFGFDKNRIKARDEQGLKDAVTKSGINLANLEADNFRKAGINVSPIKTATFNAGALTAMAGTIFEESIKATTKQFKRLGTQNNQSFDFFGGQISGLKKGVYNNLPSNVRFADAKANSLQTDNFADKMVRFGAGNKNISARGSKEMLGLYRGPTSQKIDKRARVSRMLGVGLSGARSKAGGYIPNFPEGYIMQDGRPVDPVTKRYINKQEFVKRGGVLGGGASQGMGGVNNSAKDASKGLDKVAKSGMMSGGKLLTLSFASSMLAGSTQDANGAVGVFANSLSKNVSTLATVGLLATSFEGLAKKGSGLGMVLGKLGPIAIAATAVKTAFSFADDMIMLFSGETKQAAVNVDIMAESAKNAAVRLNELDPAAKGFVKDQTNEMMSRILGATSGDLKGVFDTAFEDKDAATPIITEAINNAISSGVGIGQIEKILKEAKDTGSGTDALVQAGKGLLGLVGIKTKDTKQLTNQDVAELTGELGAASAAFKGVGEKIIQDAFDNLTPNPLEDSGQFGQKRTKGQIFRDQLLNKNQFGQSLLERVSRGRQFSRLPGDDFGREVQSVEKQLLGAGLSKDRVADLIKGAILTARKERDRFAAEDAALENKITGREVTQILQQGLLGQKLRGAAPTEAGTILGRSKAFSSIGAFQLNQATQTRTTELAQQSAVESVGEAMANINEIARAITGSGAGAERGREFIQNLTFGDISQGRSAIEKQLRELRDRVFGERGGSMFTDAQIRSQALRLQGIVQVKENEAEIKNILQQQTFEIETQGSIREKAGAEQVALEKKMLSGELAFGAVRSASPFARARGKFQLNQAGQRLEALELAKDGDFTMIRALDLADQLNGKLISASESFAQNIGNALVDAISKGESLGDTLMAVAADFFNTMSKALMQNAIYGGMNSMGGIFNFNSGGKVRGGSGMRDDVPALLTGGEFVMNKKAVQNYGAGFMGALNSGAVPKYANGGLFTPGTYGQGAISGSSNLLKFATQSYTGGLQDRFLSGSGLAGLSLEPQSGRLTMFGRKNSPAFQREQESKRKAFSLFSQQYSKDADARNSKSSNNLLGSILGFGISAGASALFGSGLSGLFSKKATGGSVPYSAGIDSVPTMLSGGEFVMNAGAAQRLGAGNLAALNAGVGIGGGGGDGAIVGKLDELNETIASSNTEINITVNSDGTENTNSSNAPEQQRSLAGKIKDVVRQVIEDEKRLGGSLRMA